MDNQIDEAVQSFFDALFDYKESTSMAKHSKGTKVYCVEDQDRYVSWANFFCINPLHPTQDLNPTEEYHHADRPRRSDKNVVTFRNILIEMDNSSIADQKKLIQEIGMPWTTCVFSGSKSLHFIISLETPMADEASYRKLVERIHAALGGKTVVDTACKNPSRFSRFPNALRHDKDNTKQDLIKVQERVQNDVLLAWIESQIGTEVERPVTAKGNNDVPTGTYDNTISSKRTMNGYTLNFIMLGATKGERNQSLFRAACDLCKCGYDDNEAYHKLASASGLDHEEIIQTIKSAYRKVESSQD